MNARCFLIWLGCFSLMTAGMAAQEPTGKVPQVPVVRPVDQKVTDYAVFSGRTETTSRVELRCRVSGYLLKTHFQEGSNVKQGEVLFEIDPRPYRAAMDRADATVGLAEARLKLAETNHKRAAALQARGAIGPEEFDKAVAERAEAAAGVRVARASREAALLDLDFTRVVAPMAGRIGRRLIDPGNLVKADETQLAVIVSVDPMHVFFDVEERTLLRLMRSIRGEGKADKVPVEIAVSDHGFPHRGVVDFVNNQFNPATGVQVRAVVTNNDGSLTPGMLVRIRLALGPPQRALLIPARAIMVEEGERFVYVVNDKNVLETRTLKLGQRYDGLQAVEEGLKAEDRVVVGGLGRLWSGRTVQPRLEALPEKQPGDSPDDAGQSAAPWPRGPFGPGILIEAVYPGASASIVAWNVRWPIEEMVGGIEGLRHLRSRCTSDGRLTVALTFNRGVDLPRMQRLTQSRVNRALRALPDAVKQAGVSVSEGTSGAAMIVNLFSPDNKYDVLYLGNYANIHLRDELARVEGVDEVKQIGHGESALRVWLDPAKLAHHKLNPGEVSRQIANEKDAGGADQDRLENLILKADGEKRVIRLRDVARLELGADRRHSEVLLDGRPGVALVIYPTGEAGSQKMRAALQKRLAELRNRLPDGLVLDATFDLAENAEYLLLDLDVPVTVAPEPMEKVLSRCDELLRRVSGVEHVLALSANPFDLFGGGPCVLVRLRSAEQRKTAREKVVEAIRTRLEALEEATVRIRDVSQPGRTPDFRYPIDLALNGPEAARVRDWARELGERLARSKKLTDIWVNRDAAPRLHRIVDIDRDAAAVRGVSLPDIMNTLRVFLGAQDVGDFNSFGRNWRIKVQANIGPGDWTRGLRELKIRNSRGQMIPLSAFLRPRETTEPLALHFLDYQPMVEVTANPAAGVTLEQARKLCEAAAHEARNGLGLGVQYRLTWLQDR